METTSETPSIINVSKANIKDFKGFKFFGDFELNTNSSKTLIKLTNKQGRNQKGGHVYCIVVDGIIKKIGCSVTELNNFAGYGVGNAGSPSDRTTGIHYYIARELHLGKSVKFYYQMCPTIKEMTYINLFGEEETTTCGEYVDKKIMESKHLNKFYSHYNGYPDWNKQEQGREKDWEKSIKDIRLALCSNQIIPYSEDHENDIIMKLYHWKYNNKPQPTSLIEANK